MALISCPVCKNAISEQAPTCPSCGHPIKRPPRNLPSSTRVTTSGLAGSALALFLILIIVGVILAALTKPSENQLKGALSETYGPVYGAATVAEKLGVIEFTYHDYILFSTLSANVVTQPNQLVAYGYLGKSYAPMPEIDLGFKKSASSATPSVSLDIPPNKPAQPPSVKLPLSVGNENNLPPPSNLPPEEIRKGLRELYPRMKSEMLSEAFKAAQQKHPASNFIGNGCDEASFDTKAYEEVRWTYHGTYNCQMRGAILGIATFAFEVKVEGQVEIRNGQFTPQILSSSY